MQAEGLEEMSGGCGNNQVLPMTKEVLGEMLIDYCRILHHVAPMAMMVALLFDCRYNQAN
jgi:hypothetical protein